MGVSSREEIVEVLDALDYDQDRLDALTFDTLTTPERMSLLARLERAARRMRAPQHRLINQLDAQAGKEELGGTLRGALADRLRITEAEAGRRVEEAADLGERRALTGEPLEPRLPATAAAQREGQIGDAHTKVIRSFFAHLPAEVGHGTRQAADTDLAATPASTAPMSWPNTPNASWTSSTPTGNSATTSAPASAASPSAARNTTRFRGSAAFLEDRGHSDDEGPG